MADNEEQQVSSSSALFTEDFHHYQAEPEPDLYNDMPHSKQDLFSVDDIVDLVGGAHDALERHMVEAGEPHELTESLKEEPSLLELDPEPQVLEKEEEEEEYPVPDSTSFSSPHMPSPPEAEPQVCPESDALPAAAPTPAPAPAQPAASSPAEEAQPPADTQRAPAPASYVPSSPSKAQPQTLMQFPTEHWDSPFLASQDTSKVSMDPFSKDAPAVGSPGYKPELHSDPSDDDDDLMYEVKKNNNPFDGFSPLADSSSYNFGESKSDNRAAKVSESPTPDLVQYKQSEELQDSPLSFVDEGKTLETGTKALESFMKPVGRFSPGVEEEDEDEEEDSALPPSLPDILKSSPLNPDKLDSGSSEGSPEEQSPILERRMMESPNPPINLSANNPFALDAKVSLLKEMADEMEVKVSEKPEDVKSFGAFDLVKEAEETTPAQVKVEEPVKLEQKDWFSSHATPQMTEKFEPLHFESKKATVEDSDSESATADSLSPVLEAMAKNPAVFQVEKGDTQVEPEVVEEVSEHEVSSEEFEFIERPPKGAIDEFLEALDTSKSAPPKIPEIPVDDDVSFERKGASAPAPPEVAVEAPGPSSYRLLTQSSPQKSKAELEKPPVHSAAPKSALFRMPSVNLLAVVDLLYWRDVKTTGVVFGAALLLLLSLTVCSIVSVCSYVGLALLSVTVCFRIYKGVLQAVQKSDEGHPFKQYLEREVALSEDLVHKYGDVLLEKINKTVAELRRLFLVEDLVDSIKFAVLMWILTYVGALFNGLTLVILAVIAAFSCPIVYEKHQAQIDHYLALVNNQIKDVVGKIQAKVPGMKPKAE
ncbi:reticulon-4-like isoform X2 [Corythoichthys intestinalis]|uniref:reticulon-4-like isoform X2 n=1 Tax=Corythoichthys intestinalis TaxID=161448 RepID=UPI0025A6052F|nr:reticulon-4-like isoform X2 [Corythoichthys intestinalis]